METTRISGITIYPVKSMKGISLESAILTPQGLKNDRRFMVVRDNGRFVTQRDLPRLALVHTHLDEKGVVMSLDGHGSVTVPFKMSEGAQVRTSVWGDECETVDVGDEISSWLTSALNSDSLLRIVRMAPGFIRPQGIPESLGSKTNTHFADAAPFLVANEASLLALNRELEARGHHTVPMNRFRPNIIIKGLASFEEHRTTGLSSENYRLEFCHPCERCVVTTIDQESGVKDPDWQPFRTLRDINPVPGKTKAPAFGQNAILQHGDQAIVALNDPLSGMSNT